MVMRNPAVAGSFYPAHKEELEAQLRECFAKEAGMPKPGDRRDIAAAVVPHAGYFYSGWVAAFAYARIAAAYSKPPVFVIAGPNHTGYGPMVSISKEDWQTPLGIVKNDNELGNAIKKNSKFADFDETAHDYEHSIEVQLPFLQLIYPGTELRFVPICVMAQGPETARDLGDAVFKAAAELKREIFFIASSDFTHFESAESAHAKDALAIAKLEKLDINGFDRVRAAKNATICGYGPILAAMHYARLKGCAKAQVLKYASSGDITGDYGQVVAYCSAVFPLK